MSNSLQNIHRLLSGAPYLGVAIGAVFATSFPEETVRLFWRANDALGVPWVRYVCLGAAFFYFLAWWMTSVPLPTARKKNQKYLRRSQQRLKDLQQQLIESESQEDFEAHLPSLQIIIDEIEEWLKKNMSEEAVFRFNNPEKLVWRFSYKGQGFSDPNFYNHRQGILYLNADRIAELENLVRCDGWDE